jgi:hypothetical protein
LTSINVCRSGSCCMSLSAAVRSRLPLSAKPLRNRKAAGCHPTACPALPGSGRMVAHSMVRIVVRTRWTVHRECSPYSANASSTTLLIFMRSPSMHLA